MTRSLLKSDQSGSVSVIVAFFLVLLLGVMAFTMDTGYLYLEKDRSQNAIEAAALSAVRRMCDGDWDAVARQVAAQNGITGDAQTLLVETGFYDARDEYDDDLGDYKDFGPPPSGEYENAVHIRLAESASSLTGLNPDVTVVADAVAYLERIDMASLDPQGVIHLGHNSSWESVTFYSNGDIKYPQAVRARGGTYRPPEFSNCDLLTAGNVYACQVEVNRIWTTGIEMLTVLWDWGSIQSGQGIHAGLDHITSIQPVDDDYLDYWRQRADVVYTPGEAGQDNIFYGQGVVSFPTNTFCYLVDLTADAGSERRVIFFDAGDETQRWVLIAPQSPLTEIDHTPNGNTNTISGLTFVATCPIGILNVGVSNGGMCTHGSLHVGGQGHENQAIFISAQDITIYPQRACDLIFEGAVFRCGGNFFQEERSHPDILQRIRVIADGDILGEAYSLYNDNPGLAQFRNDSRFAPPYPPAIARLGVLEKAEQ